MQRSLLTFAFVATSVDAFTLVPFAPRTTTIASGLTPNGKRALLPLRMDAAVADDKAAKAAAAKAKAAKAKAAKAEEAEVAEEKEETPEEKEAREAAELAEAEAKAKAEAEAEEAKKKAEEEAARAAERKAAAINEAFAAINMAGKNFGYSKEQFVVRWTEEAVAVVGDGNWVALTEEVPDLCDNIGLAKGLLERGDPKCVAMSKALDQLQVALTGELAIPASDLVPMAITIKQREGLVWKAYAREKAKAREEQLKARDAKLPMGGAGGRLW